MPGNIFAPQVRSSVPRNQGEIANQIYVGIVTSHSLVTHHLVDLLKMNNVLPVILGAGAKNAAILPTNAQAIIIIDLWGLPRPPVYRPYLWRGGGGQLPHDARQDILD